MTAVDMGCLCEGSGRSASPHRPSNDRLSDREQPVNVSLQEATIMNAVLATGMMLTALALASPSTATTRTPVSATRSTGIEFQVTPPSVVIFLDGRRLGSADKVSHVPTKPGRRVVRLKRGPDETEMELLLTRGKTLKFAYDFSD